MYWPKLTSDKIKEKVFDALNTNINYRKSTILGIPGTYLDSEVFMMMLLFLKMHPSCHTYCQSKPYRLSYIRRNRKNIQRNTGIRKGTDCTLCGADF